MAINEQDWAALEAAEAPLYDGVEGIFAYTDVVGREDDDHALISMMWQQAEGYVANEYGWGPDAMDADARRAATARRVARANALLCFGEDILQ